MLFLQYLQKSIKGAGFAAIAAIMLLFSVSGCSNELDVNDEWREIYVIYGLLDVEADSQVLRIGRVFQNDARGVQYPANQFDSLYPSDEMLVKMEEVVGGHVAKEISFAPTDNNEKDSGFFHSPGQRLWVSVGDDRLNPDATYRLLVRNTKTGAEATATTTVVPYPQVQQPTPDSRFALSNDPLQKFLIRFSTRPRAKFYDAAIRMNYTEYNKNNPAAKTEKSIERLIWAYYLNPTPNTGGTMLYPEIGGAEFFRWVAGSFEEDPDLFRTVTSIDVVVSSGGEDLYNYILVNRPSIGVVQKRPEYWNVEGGLGLFSSRSVHTIRLTRIQETVASLRTDNTTRFLNFE